jgi:hypothetical protein
MSRWILILMVLPLASCQAPRAAPEPAATVRFRPLPDPVLEEANWLVERVPGATWDAGLASAARELARASANRNSRLTPAATWQALALAGYPGHARFARRINGGAWPDALAEELASAALLRNQAVDVALVRRDYADGLTLWIGAIAHRPALLDPIPRDLVLDERVPVVVEVLDKGGGDPFSRVPDPILFVSRPSGDVSSHEIVSGHARYLDVFHEPGVYQLELVSRTSTDTQVVLNWSHFVDIEPPALAPVPGVSASEPQDPMEATDALYVELNKLRSKAGVQPLSRFEAFEPLAREHAALMAAHGTLGHRIPQVTEGVAARAARGFHPRALHREDLAAAPTWREALDITRLSPGHLANLLCEECTHASIGVALEPVTDRVPRLFVVWELLRFPEGPPQAIPKR